MGKAIQQVWSISGLVAGICLTTISYDNRSWAADSDLGSAIVKLQADRDATRNLQPPFPSGLIPWLSDDAAVATTPEGQVVLQADPRLTLMGIRVELESGAKILAILDTAVRNSGSLRLVDSGDAQPVTVLGWDPASDLAVLQIVQPEGGQPNPATELDGAATALDSAAALPLSERPVAWGEALRVLSHWAPSRPSLTAGIVATAPRYDVTLGAEVFMTDALVEPGTRGSAVIDADDHLIGMIAKAGANGGRAPSAAISIESIRRLVDFVNSGGRGELPKARLGVSLELSADGVMIVNVDGAAAQQAGIVPGDRIVTIDGEAVRRPEDVIGAINRKRPGDTIELTMERGEETKTLQVTLGERTRLVPP